MPKMEIKDGKFIVDGKNRFLFSAELHYFRLEPEVWEDRLVKIKNAGFDAVSFYVPWFWHEPYEGFFDFSGLTDPKRNIVAFLEMVSRFNLKVIFKPGPYIMSELKNEGLPNWLYDRIPHAIAKTMKGTPHPTRVFSYLHPDYLSYVKRWYSEVSKVIKSFENVIMVQIDNEVGMLQWITSYGDYNEHTIEKFRTYLEEKQMKDLAKELLNWACGRTFSRNLVVAYHDFIREYYAEYLCNLRKFLSDEGINVPVIVNIHGFDMVEYAKRGKRYPIGVSQLYRASTDKNVILSGDYYIGNIVHENFSDLAIANAIMLSVQNPEQPLFSAEFQSGFQMDKPKLLPSTIDLTSRLCIGNGMNGINYYLFVGGDNPSDSALMGTYHDWQAPISRDGELRRSYYVIKDLISSIRSIEEELVNSKPVFDTYFGFIPDYYSTEHYKEHGLNAVSDIEFKRDVSIFDGVIRALKLLNYNIGGVNLRSPNLDLNIRSLWVFSYKWMPCHVQKILAEYVENGGKLVLFPEIPVEDEFGNECTILKDFLGIRSVSKRGWGTVYAFGIEVNAYHVEEYELEPLTYQFARDKKGNICGFIRNVGKGSVAVLGFGLELEREYKVDIVENVCSLLGISKALFIESRDFVDGYLREGTENFIVFLNNYDDYPKDVKLRLFTNYLGEFSVAARKGITLVVSKAELPNETGTKRQVQLL
ncbi:beta-galactosidase [Fervidobacterium changbaicum]|uniref:Beta-galactosidase n=2 Tax=Fervidobacterium changbaicum TaxID=310769 RepID=A0ABX5QQK3_9BACT|nr:beta-galactosidase [Fervidobacterium changbaicum]SDH35686.1 beta-galactosidase [Fervidobacterium changbaicum]